MADSPVIIVVAGARGELGKLVCEALLTRARAENRQVLVRGLVRKGGAHVDPSADPQLVIAPVDYGNDEELRRACAGAHCLVSTLQGVDDVIIGVQSRLLSAAIACDVRRFIPSDFSIDFTKLPVGANRNFDLRRQFHDAAARLIEQARSPIEFTSIYQGAFTELMATGWVMFNYKKRRTMYFGSPDTAMQFTTWKNTAEFTAAVALDAKPTPRAFHVAGTRLTPKDAEAIAKRVTHVDFPLKRAMPIGGLRAAIGLMKLFKPGKKGDVFPTWVGMQYAYCMALGTAVPTSFDNDRYAGIEWAGIEGVVGKAFEASR